MNHFCCQRHKWVFSKFESLLLCCHYIRTLNLLTSGYLPLTGRFHMQHEHKGITRNSHIKQKQRPKHVISFQPLQIGVNLSNAKNVQRIQDPEWVDHIQLKIIRKMIITKITSNQLNNTWPTCAKVYTLYLWIHFVDFQHRSSMIPCTTTITITAYGHNVNWNRRCQ